MASDVSKLNSGEAARTSCWVNWGAVGASCCLLYAWDSSHKTTSKARQEESSISFLMTPSHAKTTLITVPSSKDKEILQLLALQMYRNGAYELQSPTIVL